MSSQPTLNEVVQSVVERQPSATDQITHYLQHKPFSWTRALCGTPNPVLDLKPVRGQITCAVCLDLWANGYRGPQS